MYTSVKCLFVYFHALCLLLSCAPQQSTSYKTNLLCHSWTTESMLSDGETLTVNKECVEVFQAKGRHIQQIWDPLDSTIVSDTNTWDFGINENEIVINGVTLFLEKLDRKNLWYYFTDVGDCDSNSTSQLRTNIGTCYEIDTVYVRLARK